MTEHDPLCLNKQGYTVPCPWCDLIAKVRADERERIAPAIEQMGAYLELVPDSRDRDLILAVQHRTLVLAARIARNGGSDDTGAA